MVIRDLQGSQDLSLGEMSQDFEFNAAVKLVTVYIKSSLPITEEVTISFISSSGNNYNTVIDSKVMQLESSYVFAAAGDIALTEGDKIRVEVTNANLSGVVYATVKAEA